jgi:hypothetical protein
MGELAAIGAQRGHLHAAAHHAGLAARFHARHACLVHGAVAGRDDHVGDRAAQHILAAVAEHGLGRGVEFGDAALRVGGDDGRQRVVHDGRLQRLRGLQFLHHRLQLGLALLEGRPVQADDDGRAVRPAHGDEVLAHVALPLAGQVDPAFPAHALAAAQLLARRCVGGMALLADDAGDGLAKHLLRLQPREGEELVVGVDQALVGIEHHHARGHGVDQRLHQRGRLLQQHREVACTGRGGGFEGERFGHGVCALSEVRFVPAWRGGHDLLAKT